jgi:hypothetical protein
MTDNYFKVLFMCMLLALTLLACCHVLLDQPWMTLGAGCLPLVWYHVFYLAPRSKNGLSQAAVDSVYYFGFLVTVAALGVSAITIASEGGATDINRVVLQFGVGLFATGYAVIARMHLSNATTAAAESPEAILDKYVRRSIELVDNIETAVTRTAEFSSIVISRTNEVTENARSLAAKSMLDVARAFDNEMKSTLSLARDGIVEVRGLLADTSFAVEREELRRSIKSTIGASVQLNAALEGFAAKTREGTEASIQAARAAIGLNHALQKVHGDMSLLSGEDGPLRGTVKSMTEAVEMITTGARAIGESFGQLRAFSDTVGESGPAFQKLRTTSKKVHDQLTALETTTLRMDAALSGLASTTKATGKLVTELDGATRAIPELTLKTGVLAAEMERTIQASLKMNEQLHDFPEHAATIRSASGDVASALAAIVDAVKAAAAHSEDLRANTEDSGRIVEGAQRLLAGASGLQSALDPIRGLLDSLADSIRASQQSLADSASGIQASIATSADTLQADVRRSGAAASLLTERLTNVAQFIIDQTRQCQGASS